MAARLPDELHQLRGTRSTRAAVRDSVAHTGAPVLPKDLTEKQRAAWREVVKFLKPRCTLTKADGIALRLYAQEWARYDALSRELEEQGEVIVQTILDSNGAAHEKRVLNPASAAATKCANFLKAMLKEFSLTPASREKTAPAAPPPPKKTDLVPGSLEDLIHQRDEEAQQDLPEDLPEEETYPGLQDIFAKIGRSDAEEENQ
jgi:P27 family predicted phage terminase small subunit